MENSGIRCRRLSANISASFSFATFGAFVALDDICEIIYAIVRLSPNAYMQYTNNDGVFSIVNPHAM